MEYFAGFIIIMMTLAIGYLWGRVEKLEKKFQKMNDVELAIRRISDRLKDSVPWDTAITNELDEIADEIAKISAGAVNASPTDPQ